ncbi:MAG: hypothetical protein HYX27_13955 [Acidobacteria bacterium]|nr:hypothetical protein [Acidobacteriota bacterium]
MASPTLRALIEKGLFERIPASFSTFFFDQIKDAATLFPAEIRYYERLFTLVDKLEPEEFQPLFSPLRAVEAKMGINEKTWPRRTFTLDQVDFLNRNPHYAEWRGEVSKIFARLDPVLDEETRRKGRPRLAVVLSPGELPVGPDRLWTRLGGKKVSLTAAFDPSVHVAPLLKAENAAPYDRWLIQASGDLPAVPGVVTLDYEALAPYRQRLMSDVQQIVEREQIRGPRELGARLKKMKLMANEGELARDPVLAEFTRAVLLAGNGTLLINNTFVEWAAVQAVRRARPSFVVVSFGIRNKLKPFSSLLIYADQEKSSVIPTQVDTLGTYVDLEVFYLYVWQEFEKYAEYVRNTAFVFAAAGMDEVRVIAPADFDAPASIDPMMLTAKLREWMHWQA